GLDEVDGYRFNGDWPVARALEAARAQRVERLIFAEMARQVSEGQNLAVDAGHAEESRPVTTRANGDQRRLVRVSPVDEGRELRDCLGLQHDAGVEVDAKRFPHPHEQLDREQ